MLSIVQARKLLGKLSENISDDEIVREIDSASLLKDMFFSFYVRGKNNSSKENLRQLTNDIQSG